MTTQIKTKASTPIRLLLSGGGHRAAVGSLGAIAYLAYSGRWDDVDEVVSVSGGSVANAALAVATPHDDPWTVVSAALERMDRDQGRVWANWRRLLILVRYLAAFSVVIAVIVVSTGFGPVIPRAVSLMVGVAAVPLLVRLGGMCAHDLTRDFISVITGRSLAVLAGDPNVSRAHLFCASGLSSGTPYLLWTGRPFAEGGDPSWGTELQAPYSVVDAAAASISLPFLGRVRSPKQSPNSEVLAGGEILVDGGVSGIFGEQAGTPFRRTPADTDRSGDKQLIAIDAGRHISSPSQFVRRLERFSVTATLLRWLKASLEATYVNDLVDLAPHTLVRLCESEDFLADHEAARPEASELDEPAAVPMPLLMAMRLANERAHGVDDRVTHRLNAIRSSMAGLNLFNLTSERLDVAVTTGFAATMITMEPASSEKEIAEALRYADSHLALGDRLSLAWAATR